MWFLLPLIGAAVLAIVALSSEEEKKARLNWENKYVEAQKTVESHRRNIEKHLQGANNSYEFSVLNDVYYSSYQVADFTYKLLTDAKVCLGGIDRMIFATDEKRKELKLKFQIRLSQHEYAEVVSELRGLRDLRFGLVNDFHKVLAEKKSLAEKVSELNQKTESLKLAIRDRCGDSGKNWYENLQRRIASRKASRS